MIDTEKVLQAIYSAVDEINELREKDAQVEKSTDTVLYGPSGNLDSIALVNLVVAIEQNIEEEFGLPIILADEKAMSQRTSPFKTIEALAQYISSLLNENPDA